MFYYYINYINYKYTSELRADELGIDVKKSNSSNVKRLSV
jgi:hypothetical protein